MDILPQIDLATHFLASPFIPFIGRFGTFVGVLQMVDLFELHIAPVPVALCGHGYDKVFNISNKLVTYLVALLNLAEG